VLFEAFENSRVYIIPKFHEKPCYYLLIIDIKLFVTIVVKTSSQSEISPAEFFKPVETDNGFKNSPKMNCRVIITVWVLRVGRI
jgi:hypothetical protein